MKQLIGFRLIKLYPGCRKQIGYFEPLTTGELGAWPEFWDPVYLNSDTPKLKRKSR